MKEHWLVRGFNAAWRAWPFVIAVLILLWVVVLAGVVAAEAARNRTWVKANLLPLVHEVEGQRDRLGRLPTTHEFQAWARQAHPDEVLELQSAPRDSRTAWGTLGRDFVVGKRQEAWMHYYQSWNGEDYSGEAAPYTPPPVPSPR